MKQKTILFVLLLCGIQALFSQDEVVTIDVGVFKEIKAFDGLSVNLIRSDNIIQTTL